MWIHLDMVASQPLILLHILETLNKCSNILLYGSPMYVLALVQVGAFSHCEHTYIAALICK